jgi:hypothetical protein
MDACHLHATLRLLCAGRRATIDPSPPAAAPVSQAGDDKRWEVSLRENSSGKFLKVSEAKQSLWNKVSGTRALRALPCKCMHMAGRVRLHPWMHAHAGTPHATFATARSLASCVSHPLNMIHTSACNAGDMWSRAHCMWGGCTKPLCPNPRVSGGGCSVHRCRPCPTRAASRGIVSSPPPPPLSISQTLAPAYAHAYAHVRPAVSARSQVIIPASGISALFAELDACRALGPGTPAAGGGGGGDADQHNATTVYVEHRCLFLSHRALS